MTADIQETDHPLFILAGNGPYANRGCEAIVRGTVKILRAHFNNPRFVCFSHFSDDAQYQDQCKHETDPSIIHLQQSRLTKIQALQNFWKPQIRAYISEYLLNRRFPVNRFYSSLIPYIGNADAVLSVGGDNYSLDYGIPAAFTALDDLIIENKKPIILWGASVGPFSVRPEYERFMGMHLNKVSGIFARESLTIDYLKTTKGKKVLNIFNQ